MERKKDGQNVKVVELNSNVEGRNMTKLSNGEDVEKVYLEHRITHLNELLEPMKKWEEQLKECKERLSKF